MAASSIRNCLKPCPFCGGQAAFEEHGQKDRAVSRVRLRCVACGVATRWHIRVNRTMNLMPILSAKWNKRV